MTLQQKLDEYKMNFEAGGVSKEIIASMHRATDELRSSGILDRIVKEGSRAPEFSLPNPEGAIINSSELLMKGSLVITFYRGHW